MSKYFNRNTDKNLVTVASPTADQLSKLELTCCEVDLARDHFGYAFVVTSGLRPPNDRYSQHEDGYAMDFIPSRDVEEVFKWMSKFVRYDQLILETRTAFVNGKKVVTKWIHMSLKSSGNRHQALIATIVVVNGKERTTYSSCNTELQ